MLERIVLRKDHRFDFSGFLQTSNDLVQLLKVRLKPNSRVRQLSYWRVKICQSLRSRGNTFSKTENKHFKKKKKNLSHSQFQPQSQCCTEIRKKFEINSCNEFILWLKNNPVCLNDQNAFMVIYLMTITRCQTSLISVHQYSSIVLLMYMTDTAVKKASNIYIK